MTAPGGPDVERLIIAVVHHDDADGVNQALIDAEYGVTRINAQGGFLRRGNAVFLVGVGADQVDNAIRVVRAHTAPRSDAEAGGSAYGILFVVGVTGHDRM